MSFVDDGSTPEDYCLIARIRNSPTGGLLIVSAGIKQFGTEAAGRLLAEPTEFSAILSKLPPAGRRRTCSWCSTPESSATPPPSPNWSPPTSGKVPDVGQVGNPPLASTGPENGALYSRAHEKNRAHQKTSGTLKTMALRNLTLRADPDLIDRARSKAEARKTTLRGTNPTPNDIEKLLDQMTYFEPGPGLVAKS